MKTLINKIKVTKKIKTTNFIKIIYINKIE